MPRSLWVFALLLATSLHLPTTRADFNKECPSSDKTVWLSLDNCNISLPGLATVHSWGALMGVAKDEGGATGSSAKQFCFSPSTVPDATFLMDVDICQGTNNLDGMSVDQCRSRRGNLIDRSQLDYSTDTSSLGDNDAWKTFQSPLPAFQFAAMAYLSLPGRLFNMTIGLITESKNSNQHQLGLAGNSGFLNTLKEKFLIDSKTWGINFGSTSEKPRPGSLVIGGYDKNSLKTSPVRFNMSSYPKRLGNRPCLLQVKVNQMDLMITTESGVMNTTTISEPSRAVMFCIEPNDRLPRLPGTLYADFLQVLKDVANVTTTPSDTAWKKKESDTYILEPGLAFPSSQNKFTMSLKLTFNVDDNPKNVFVVTVPDHELKRPLSGIGKDGSNVVDNDQTELSIFSQTNVEDAASLGRSVLSQVYLFVDPDQHAFYLAQQNMDAGIPQPVASTCVAPAVPDMKDRQLYNSEFIALVLGSVVGIIALCIGLIVGVMKLWKCWNTRGPMRANNNIRVATSVSDLPSGGDGETMPLQER